MRFLLLILAGLALMSPAVAFGDEKQAEKEKEFEKGLAELDKAIAADPDSANLYMNRGSVHFFLAHIEKSLADFDKADELNPKSKPHNWQRGIALYYAGRFEDGQKQFEIHQTVNPNDVENAAWHYLCVARRLGVEKARASLIKIEGDGRVPMMDVFAMFGGKKTVEDVIAAAKAGDPKPEQLRQNLCFAHLYIGLYFEAAGDAAKAKEHITLAAEEYAVDNYMGEVARVHLKLMGQSKK